MTMRAAGMESLPRLKEVSRRIREAAMAAADPFDAVTRALTAQEVSTEVFALNGRLILLAVGKAAGKMTAAAMETLRQRGLHLHQGLVVLPHGYPTLPALERFPGRVFSAGHPVPDSDSVAAAAAAIGLVERMAEDDTCLLLLSGGGSSLLSFPHPPLALPDLAETNRLLLASGAGIAEINTVRRHLSFISGGRLAARCRGTMLTLAVSDVVGDDPAAIASGPTVADPTTFADALAVLERKGLLTGVPPGVRAFLEAGAAGTVPETPKQIAARHTARVIASGLGSVEAAAAAARGLGFTPRVLTTRLEGEAREAGRTLARAALEARADEHAGGVHALPACLIAAGETTVMVRGTGKGGRNQELALSAARILDGIPGVLLTSFASDGVEGNTDAAGACASGATIAAGRAAGMDAVACLAENNSYPFLAAAGELIITGPTGTNVSDITFILLEREQDWFDSIYTTKAVEYHELVRREDAAGNLPAALRDIVDFAGRTVVEMGAGTGRVTKIVASTAARVLAFDRSPHMLDRARELLAGEVTRNVTLAAAENDAVPLPDGCADIVIEGWSFGHTVTGSRAPTPPGTVLPRFYAWLENDRGFTARWIRTDYVFESLDKARELVEFFFGSMVEHEIRPDGSVLVPECTGLWWRRKP